MLMISSAPEAIKCARDFARGWFDAKGYTNGVRDVALLVVTELVTNAYKHGSEPGEAISVHLYLSTAGPVTEVRDRSNAEPHVKPLTPHSFSGRGLAIVSELTTAWGFCHLASGGKAVFAV
ncbi:ATP-binding protein, partial [Actinomadura kijaniata]|uniref:ATP-binding protein n=1 Tax=Actinomadura kijaniata TaxID=46161 RepID=UPI0009FDFB99